MARDLRRSTTWCASPQGEDPSRDLPRWPWRVVDREALPPGYLKAVPDTLAIRKALARGEEVPGVAFVGTPAGPSLNRQFAPFVGPRQC